MARGESTSSTGLYFEFSLNLPVPDVILIPWLPLPLFPFRLVHWNVGLRLV